MEDSLDTLATTFTYSSVPKHYIDKMYVLVAKTGRAHQYLDSLLPGNIARLRFSTFLPPGCICVNEFGPINVHGRAVYHLQAGMAQVSYCIITHCGFLPKSFLTIMVGEDRSPVPIVPPRLQDTRALLSHQFSVHLSLC